MLMLKYNQLLSLHLKMDITPSKRHTIYAAGIIVIVRTRIKGQQSCQRSQLLSSKRRGH